MPGRPMDHSGRPVRPNLLAFSNRLDCDPDYLARRNSAVAISKEEIFALMNGFHDVVMYEKGSAKDQAKFFLYPEPRIFIPHGEDISLQTNYEIHQTLTDEKHVLMDQWEITALCDQPERARVVGAVYWEGRLLNSAEKALIKCVVGEDWIVQRLPSGELKIALYINAYHHFLPDSAAIQLN